jgi:FkbM family methyltransferase
MFARTLARTAAVVPTPVKYALARYKKFFTRLMSAGQGIVRVTTDAGSFRWRVDELTSQRHLLGTYEPYMQQCFRQYVSAGDVVFDVGAHAGFHSLFLGLLAGEGTVFAFEPNPRNLASIRSKIALNPELPVIVLPFALSDRRGPVHLVPQADTSQCAIAESGGEIVQARTIDDLVAAGVVPPPAFLKIDVEGHEAAVLEGARHTLAAHKPIVVCDYNDGTTLQAVQAMLAPAGYTVRDGPPVVAIPFFQ